ncbi:MAG: hypothetical protein IJU58_01675 [Clostridia bacterium]|nr:hypothetical protein [Clostridia bacterium]
MTFSKTIKTTLLTLVLALTLFLMQSPFAMAGASMAFSGLQSTPTLADPMPTSAISDVSSKISNNNFSSTGSSTSSNVYAPSSWSLSSSDAPTTLKYGVIDLDKLNQNYSSYGFTAANLPSKTSYSENKVLMINSDSETSGAKLGYAQSFSLEAGAFYRLAINVFTSSDGFATIYLNSDSFDASTSKIAGISTEKAWNTYYIYIATSPYASTSVSLGLYLGEKDIVSNGYVLFDNISLYQFSENAFPTTIPAKAIMIDKRVTAITSPTADGYVDTNMANWTQEDVHGTAFTEIVGTNYTGANGYLHDVHPGANLSNIATVSGLAFSCEDAHVSFKSPDITIKRNKIYRISFYAKGNITSGNMNAVLSGEIFNTPDDEDNNVQSASFTSLSTSSNKFTNDWIQYSFYVTGSSLYDTTVNLYLGLGSDSANATGYAIFAYIQSFELTADQYTSGQNIGQTTTLSMSANPSLNFANSAFNSLTVNDDPTSPSQPNDWTHIAGDQTAATVYGVVNTLSTEFVKYTSLGSEVISPLTKNGDYTNNALVLRNISSTYQGYYCATNYTISADNYYLMTIDVNLQKDLLSESTSGAYIYLKDNNGNNLASFRYAGNNTNSWQTLKVYLHGSFQDRSVLPYLYLGNEQNPTCGVVFFDNCKITTSDETAFKAATNGATTKVVDLANSLFSLYDSVDKNIYTPSLWGVTNGDTSLMTTKMGIIKGNNSDTLPSFITTPPSTENEDMLMIGSSEESFYSYTSRLDYALSASTYYQISVDVKTAFIKHTLDTDTENEDTKFGASIVLNDVTNAMITDINTQKHSFASLDAALADEDNHFVTYTLYLYPTDATTTTIKLALGSEDKLCSGYAFFKNIVITQIDKDTYDSDISTLTNNNKTSLPATVLDLVDAPEEDTNEDNESYKTNSDWWASTFTIIIALAVVVALIGFAIKRINARRGETVSVSNNYDRLQTLLKDVDRRNKMTSINAKIRNLQEELKQSEQFLQEEQQALQKESTSYKTAKEIADDTGIAIDSPQTKLDAMQNNIDELEQKIESIKLDIQVLEDEKARIKNQEKQDIERSKKAKIIKTRK